ncbi:Cholinephosphotransferase 1 (Diacylglycerol cholinephosphotransferase 1) [Durusdinium trenchii]|uniref:Cholinephosphotransferase 1 (Diacylglycerol cholinephosphotransferase 1) n=2 Tax=Durusdinium trenchii TaxID=1381693 RepID=A0ABP0HZP1_9DINO
MTCDAVDGKHARNTKQSTPLGAVVDHGIDAFCAFTTGVAVTVTADPALEDPWLMLAYCMFHGAWFSAQWGELTWGSLDQRGITEGEFASMLVIALPGILGPNFRDHWIPTWVPLLGGRKAGVEPGGEGGGMLEVRGLQPGKQDGMSLFVGCVTIL